MIEAVSFADLPAIIEPAHVYAEARLYPRPLVLLEDQFGWAAYATADSIRRSPYRRTWTAALLDYAALLPRHTHRALDTIAVPTLAHVEGCV